MNKKEINRQVLIRDLIELPPVKTVISLEEGRDNPEDIANSFVFTEEVASHVTVLTESFLNRKGQGYFLKGDYGSGKSHFLAAIYSLLYNKTKTESLETLAKKHNGIKQLIASNANILPVDISLVNYRAKTSLEEIIIKAIEKALKLWGIDALLTPLSLFIDKLKKLLEESDIKESFSRLIGVTVEDVPFWIEKNPGDAFTFGIRLMKNLGLKTPESLVEERHETLSRALTCIKNAGFDGVILIIDELSEFFRSKSTPEALNEDARMLQLLGEMTSREPMWIIAAVQESIERTGDISQVTFRKIKDRFPIVLTLSTVHIRSLISKRLVHHKPGADDEIYNIFETYKSQFSSFNSSYNDFKSIYPVHPETINLLNGLGDLFSEHRGIVDFVYSRIAGDARRNIKGILDRNAIEMLSPDSIFDHFAGRLAEFSQFNIYPGQIVPHLDEVIKNNIDDEEDRRLAKRLIRILILYKIHPTADKPTVRKLTELVAYSLGSKTPEHNVKYISEVLLDPIVDSSRFLIKDFDDSPGKEGTNTIYSIVTRDDPGKILKAKIVKTAEDISTEDSRLLIGPLSELKDSQSWMEGIFLENGVLRDIIWNFSNRTVLIIFLQRNYDRTYLDKVGYDISSGIESGKIDFVFIITPGNDDKSLKRALNLEHIAIWQLPFPNEKKEILKEYLAVKLIQEELNPGNPADITIMELVKEKHENLKPSVHKIVLDAFYSGSFSDSSIEVEPVVRQLKIFNRLLEIAGMSILQHRYPKYIEVKPRRINPFPRYYQQLLNEFVLPGSILMREARAKSLSDKIDGLVVPLGLAEIKGVSFVFSPDITGNPFLCYFFKHLKPSGTNPMAAILLDLKTGPYGLPEETSLFLIASLALAGIITLLKSGRAVPINYISLDYVKNAEFIAPGELIAKADRDSIYSKCSFLLPAHVSNESFGLSQQRDVWKEIIKFKETAILLSGEIRKQFEQIAEYSSFSNFKISYLNEKLIILKNLSEEIKVSYTAKDGIERFLKAWRGTGYKESDIDYLKKLKNFLSHKADEFVFINYYMNHSCIKKVIHLNEDVSSLYHSIMSIMEEPELLVVEDEGKQLGLLFTHFKENYLKIYLKQHTKYYNNYKRFKLSRFTKNSLRLVRSFSLIEQLDRPAGLNSFLEEINLLQVKVCKRKIKEELFRNPVCSCGFKIGDKPEEFFTSNPDDAINEFLLSYINILSTPAILESISARIYAISDHDPESAKRLKNLYDILQNNNLSPSNMPDVFDEDTINLLKEALSNSIAIVHRDINELESGIIGRRLTADAIIKKVYNWISNTEENTLIAIDSNNENIFTGLKQKLNWWPELQTELFKDKLIESGLFNKQNNVNGFEEILEEKYPEEKLRNIFLLMDTNMLTKFILREKFHIKAIQLAWQTLAEKILTDFRWLYESDITEERSDYIIRERAGEIVDSVCIIESIAKSINETFPLCLTHRIPAEKLLFHPWTTDKLQCTVFEAIQKIEKTGADWLKTLKPVESVALENCPLVLIIDGVSPDVFLEAIKEQSGLQGLSDVKEKFKLLRLKSKPKTVDSIADLFGFNGDPVEMFNARDIPYHNLKGNETFSIIKNVLPFPEDKPVVIRLSIIDRAAHDKGMHLSEMVVVLRKLFEGAIKEFYKICDKEKREIIVTTDHGLSLTNKGLSHGNTGVFEEVVFRI